jgi:hypothetical protein
VGSVFVDSILICSSFPIVPTTAIVFTNMPPY